MWRGCPEDGERKEVSLGRLNPRVLIASLGVGSVVPVINMESRIEVAVKQILSGIDVKTNASVANPEALAWFRRWAELHE